MACGGVRAFAGRGGGGGGGRGCARLGVAGARGEAAAGFPHVMKVGLPALHSTRRRGSDEACARLDALMAIMSSLDDTCLLHRGGWAGLNEARCWRSMRSCCGATPPPVAAPTCWRPACFWTTCNARCEDLMEILRFTYPAARAVARRAHVGVVGSG